MNWQLVPLDQVAATRWRNGGGRTRELLAWPSASDWQVRISVADVESDGPFSSFPGIERWFAVVEGEGVTLCADGVVHHLSVRSEPLRFAGEALAQCSLCDGATQDFNLMAPPGRARLRRVRGKCRFEPGAASLIAVYAHRCALRVATPAAAWDVHAATLAWARLPAAVPVTVESEDALWMEVTA